MNVIELRARVTKGEDLHTEFKEKLTDNESIARSIICFANTDGGQVIIGVKDNGEIIGVENIDEINRQIDDVAFNRCEPPVTIIQETLSIEGKTILVVNIPKGEQRPYRTSSGFYYIRSTNRCRQASREELLRLFQATESIFYDEMEIQKASLKDLDLDFFETFIKNYMDVDIVEELQVSYMKNLGVLSSRDIPTVTGLLFFGRKPQFFIPYARVVSAYFEDGDIATPPSDKKEFLGMIPEILEDILRFLKIYIKEEHRIKGMESEIYPEIPDTALREALVNAIAHRDYTISAPIRIFIFKDRVEFHTPGRLPNTVTIESMRIGGSHVPRNPTIYNLFAKMGLVTDIGSGVFRIIKLVKQTVGKETDLKVTDNEFVLTIPRK